MANVERLLQLRRVVEAAPDDRFHMRAFYEEASCGTAYCAAGWAAVDPWFQEHTEIGSIFRVGRDGLLEILSGTPFRRLSHIFEIGANNSWKLFGWGVARNPDPHAVSKAEVIENIDRLLAGKSAELYKAAKDEY